MMGEIGVVYLKTQEKQHPFWESLSDALDRVRFAAAAIRRLADRYSHDCGEMVRRFF